jgi:hypothetical protein
MSYRQRVLKYVEVVTYVTLIQQGLELKNESVEHLLKLYEAILNHRAYLPGVLDQLAKDQKSWTRQEESAALKEVGKWNE